MPETNVLIGCLVNIIKKESTGMNFSVELQRKLTWEEYSLVRRYIEKATEAYQAERYSVAREALLDAIAVAASKGENNAAGKIQYYLRFC